MSFEAQGAGSLLQPEGHAFALEVQDCRHQTAITGERLTKTNKQTKLFSSLNYLAADKKQFSFALVPILACHFFPFLFVGVYPMTGSPSPLATT